MHSSHALQQWIASCNVAAGSALKTCCICGVVHPSNRSAKDSGATAVVARMRAAKWGKGAADQAPRDAQHKANKVSKAHVLRTVRGQLWLQNTLLSTQPRMRARRMVLTCHGRREFYPGIGLLKAHVVQTTGTQQAGCLLGHQRETLAAPPLRVFGGGRTVAAAVFGRRRICGN